MANVLAYVDEMFTPSESFVHRAYRAFDTLTPIFVGNSQRGPAPEGTRVIDIKPLHGLGGEAAFKQLGVVSEQLKARLAAERPIAIHAHFGKGGVYAMPLARALNVPLVVTYYGGDATKKMNTSWLPIRAYNRFRSEMWREAALILPCSDFIRRELEMQHAQRVSLPDHGHAQGLVGLILRQVRAVNASRHLVPMRLTTAQAPARIGRKDGFGDAGAAPAHRRLHLVPR